MVTAFVLINVESNKRLREIADSLLGFNGILEVHVVAGEYDMVAVVRVHDNATLSELITEKIIHAPGVKRTKTLFALESYSSYDLSALFEIG